MPVLKNGAGLLLSCSIDEVDVAAFAVGLIVIYTPIIIAHIDVFDCLFGKIDGGAEQ